MTLSLLGTTNAKTSKGVAQGYITGILYLNPLDFDLCPKSTEGCRKACLFTAGRGAMPNVIAGRTRKTKELIESRAKFILNLEIDIEKLVKKAKREGVKLAIRLNGTSDLPWHLKSYAKDLMAMFPEVQFYDYTKVLKHWKAAQSISNYHMTFSASEENHAEYKEVLAKGGQVAIVSSDPTLFTDYPTHNGDKHDLTFLQGSGYLVLSPKGKAKKDETGFVVGSAVGLIPVKNVA